MPDLGIGAIARRAVRAASKDARVLRPNEAEALKADAAAARAKAGLPPEAPVVSQPLTPEAVAATPPEPVIDAPTTPPPPEFTKQPLPPVEITDTTAKRLSEARLGDYALDYTHQMNFDQMRTTDDIKAAIADRATANVGRIEEARRGTITHEQLRGLSEDLDMDQDVVRQVIERESGGALNAETILAARQTLNSSADRLQALASKITEGKATDLERLQFRRQIQFHDEFQTQFMGARAEAGRALNAFNIPVGFDSVNMGRVREAVDSMFGDTDQLAQAVSRIDSTSGVSNFTRKYNQSRLFGTLNELFVNSTLSGPTTHIVNAWGNVLMQAMNTAETAYAARIGQFLGTEDRVAVGEATSMIHGTVSGVRDAWRLAWRAMKKGKTLDDVSKFEYPKAISARNLLPEGWRQTPLGGATDALGTFIRVPTERVMAPTDEFFKTIAYRAEIERQAFLHVQQQLDSGAITAADAARAARDFLENTPLKAQQAAEEYMKYVTFQNPLGEKGAAAQRFVRSVPALGLIAPYVRTPINIFKAGLLDRSPVAFFSKKFYKDLQAGGRQRDMALARVSLGSATAAFVANEVMNGNISGAGPRDPDARVLLWATGWRPYSIKDPATGQWHSYARMEPWASVVGATADTIEIGSYINEDADTMKDQDQIRTDAAAAVIAGIANNTMNKTFMKGMADFSEMVSDPGRYSQSWGGQLATAIVPYSAARRQIAKSTDPYMREAWTLNERLAAASGIPGWSEDAPPRRDIFGNPRKYATGWILGTMSPMPDSKPVHDRVLDELVTLMNETRQVPVAMPGKSIEGMRLQAKEYDDLVRIARSSPIFDGGEKTLKEKIEDVMDSDVYALATPVYKAELIKSLQIAADRIVTSQGGLLEQTNPQYAERIALYRAKKARLRFGKEEE